MCKEERKKQGELINFNELRRIMAKFGKKLL